MFLSPPASGTSEARQDYKNTRYHRHFCLLSRVLVPGARFAKVRDSWFFPEPLWGWVLARHATLAIGAMHLPSVSVSVAGPSGAGEAVPSILRAAHTLRKRAPRVKRGTCSGGSASIVGGLRGLNDFD